MITRKKYTLEFKKALGLELASGSISAAALSKREGIAPTMLYKWRDMILSTGGVIDHDQEIFVLRKKVQELEELISDQALGIFILKKTQKLMEQLQRQENLSGSISQQNLVSKKVARP